MKKTCAFCGAKFPADAPHICPNRHQFFAVSEASVPGKEKKEFVKSAGLDDTTNEWDGRERRRYSRRQRPGPKA